MTKHEPHANPGYEKTDAHAGATFRAGLYILGTMLLTALVVVPMYRLLGRREKAEQERAPYVLKPEPHAAPSAFPRLVTDEPAVLAAFRAQEDQLLTGYGWVEKDKGIARIPVAEAMRIVAARGLPKFPGPATNASPAGGAR